MSTTCTQNVQPTSLYGNIVCPEGFSTANTFSSGVYAQCPADTTQPCNRCQRLNAPATLSYCNVRGQASTWPVTASGGDHVAPTPPSCGDSGHVNRYGFAQGPVAIATGVKMMGCTIANGMGRPFVCSDCVAPEVCNATSDRCVPPFTCDSCAAQGKVCNTAKTACEDAAAPVVTPPPATAVVCVAPKTRNATTNKCEIDCATCKGILRTCNEEKTACRTKTVNDCVIL